MASLVKAPFTLGRKEVYLPNFTITFLRSARLPPTFARFIVPLNMNKLDMRDYLYHVYNVRTVSVRSFIEQQPVRSSTPSRPAIKSFFRPRAIKKMTVELESPFVWPEVPQGEALKPWSHDTFHAAQKDNEAYQMKNHRLADAMYSQKDRDALRAQARRLLEGKEAWKPGMDIAGGRK